MIRGFLSDFNIILTTLSPPTPCDTLSRVSTERTGGLLPVLAAQAIEGVRVNPCLRWISLVWLWCKRPFLLPRVRRHSLETVDGLVLVVWPDVLNPVVFRSGKFLAETIGQ